MMEVLFTSQKPLSHKQMDFLFEIEKKMIEAGITFDTGFDLEENRRDWWIIDAP